MKAVFLSDAHIRDHSDPNLPPLLEFLRRLRGEVDRLFIVGDLFDTWFAFPRAVFDEYVPVLGALDELVRRGARITYVTGNHDFVMGHFFENILSAEVHDTEMSFEADGLRAYVAHGDMVDESDRGYRRLRRILHSGLMRGLGRALPPSWVWRFCQALRRECKKKRREAPADLHDRFIRFAEKKHAEGFDAVILAHLHAPLFEADDSPRRVYVNLGNWVEERTFLRWDDGRLSLRQWAWPEAAEREYSPA